MSNTFGLAITAETVRAMGRYDHKDTIDQVDCAREAMRLIHAEDKNLDALAYAWDLKGMYGNGKTSIVLVYNATGDRLTLGDGRDWSGRIYGRQPPRDFQNGQWIAFLHVRSPSNPNELQAARVFRGRNVDGRAREFLVSWAIPLQGSQNNSAYTEIRDANGFAGWTNVRNNLLRAKLITRANDNHKCASTISMGGYWTAECIAVLQHQFEPLPDPYART
ncbi:23 kDa jasmonate-induced protein-like [Lolium rigidum]|uniref:23 kDa jasmonate-induced protein-like n=1 Tax=Lolium rigidum TaxID=89674 RepID=UPI001F5CDB3B|nr:23 kDa jasmonate-induced protein-like [Lolium rigidum]